jgi:hypothetical protein
MDVASGHQGHGLVGLRERAQALSGQLRTISSDEGVVLRVELPSLSAVAEQGPVPAAVSETDPRVVGDGAATPDARVVRSRR